MALLEKVAGHAGKKLLQQLAPDIFEGKIH
jgi:hypothetical protein